MWDFLTNEEKKIFKRYNTPAKIQDFLNATPNNFEPNGDECKSPREVLKAKNAHCVEGALLAAAMLGFHGEPMLLLDLTASKKDFDHVVTLFKRNNCWGAISKTNHAVLRYREPVYRTIRELALSYFHEYFTHDGTKNLRSYSRAFSLKRFTFPEWIISEDNVWEIPEALADAPHIPLFTTNPKSFRRADAIEIASGKLVDWQKKK